MSAPEVAEVPTTVPVVPETPDDVDSGLGENESTYTDSLRSSLLESMKENGRGYHKSDRSENNYALPEDQREQDRLDLQHELFSKSFSGKLALAPIGHNLRNVLDLGTGTGIWCIDFADQHPEADVLGIDLSAIQPSWVPPNCKFEIDDFDEEWTYTYKFSYIHSRMLNTVVKDLPKLMQRALNALEDGGWLELQDVYIPMMCDDGSMRGTDFEKWNELLESACLKVGRDPKWPARYKDALTEAGFENVTEKIFKWPINTWPKDQQMKEIGQWNLVNMLDGLEGFTYRLFTQVLGWSVEEVEVFLARVRKDLHNKKMHSYWRIHVVYGQKPKSGAT